MADQARVAIAENPQGDDLAVYSLGEAAPVPSPQPGAVLTGGATNGTSTARQRIERRTPGRLLPHRLGPYLLFDHIGRGGMADIYRARIETSLGATREVVVKEVLPELRDATRFADLLVDEAKLASRLNHKNIVTIEHLGRSDDTLYIAMEYVEGLDLRELLKRCARQRVGLPVEFAVLMVTEILRALDYAHRHEHAGGVGIIHRDVSPSNVLLSFEGEIKMCDFGIAVAHHAALSICEDAIEGKAGYMSPEQARGGHLDPRSDLYAAGILLWEMLAGRRLYKPRPGETLLEAAERAVVPPLVTRDLPRERELHGIVRRLLARDPEARYSTAGAAVQDLEAFAGRSGLWTTSLRFGHWLEDSFADQIRQIRRGREQAVEALGRGPVMVLEPLPTSSELMPRPTADEESPKRKRRVAKKKRTNEASDSPKKARRRSKGTGRQQTPRPDTMMGPAMSEDPKAVPPPPASLAATTKDIHPEGTPPSSRGSATPRYLFWIFAAVVAAGVVAWIIQQ